MPSAVPAVKTHYRALSWQEVRGALDTVNESDSGLAAKLHFSFLILTATLSGEVRGATWNEIDKNTREWRIHSERMKSGAEHRIPLSDAAVAVLEKARLIRDGSDLIFPAPARPGKPLSNVTLTKVLRDNGLADQTTAHGFRSSFRTWCADTGKPRELAEAALAHIIGGVEGAYFRSDLYERRRRLMDQWADYLHGAPAKVRAIR